MRSFLTHLMFTATLTLFPACASTPAAAPAPSASSEAPPPEHRHELHLPPAAPQVSVALDGKAVPITLADLAGGESSVALPRLWKAAFPAEDPALLHFDVAGADGFHPATRPACTRLLTGTEIAAARIDVATHDLSFADSVKLPGCYRVKGVARIEASR